MDEPTVTLPADVARALFAVYETWWHQVGTYDPGHELVSDGTKLTGIGGLLTSEDDDAMEAVCVEVEKHEQKIRAALDLGGA